MMDSQIALISIITRQQDLRSFKEQHWIGSFQEYLKQGVEEYSKIPEGGLFTFSWIPDLTKPQELVHCPMHEEPMHLIPVEYREAVLAKLNEGRAEDEWVQIEGDLCPACRQYFKELN